MFKTYFTRKRLEGWLIPLVILAAGLVMVWWTWRKWPDLVVDFGRELYVPWQLAEGKLLYRDIACVQGPLSAYLNSFWFRLFGVSLTTLVIWNLIITAGIVCLLYRLLAEISSRFAATMACLTFVLLFACPHFSTIGNFNYVCPYRHEATHGMFLSLVALRFLSVYLRNHRTAALAGTGLFTGAVFLTKGELFVAVFSAICVGIAISLSTRPFCSAKIIKGMIAFGAALVAVPFVVFLLFWIAASPREAVMAVLGWIPATTSEAFRNSPFMRYGMGIDGWPGNTVLLLKWSFYYAVFFALSTLAALALRRRSPVQLALSIGVFALIVLAAWKMPVPWSQIMRPLPVVLVGLGLALLIGICRRRDTPVLPSEPILALALIVFSAVLLGKMFLLSRIYHYGFVLAMPATLMLVVALFGWIPTEIERRGGYGGFFVAAALAVLLLTTHWYLNAAAMRLRNKTQPVSVGSDMFFGDQRAAAVNRILTEISQRTKPEQTLAVLPQGVMLNYLSRRANSVPYIDLVPTEYFFWGEDRIKRSFREHPPDFIALVQIDSSEFGYRFFGKDYGRELLNWIESNYKEVVLAGARPFIDDQFGILLLERKTE